MKNLFLSICFIAINFSAFAIAEPTIASPSNGAIGQSVYLMLDWSGITGATYYDVEIDIINDFSSPNYDLFSVSSSASYIYVSDLFFETEYFWRVRARSASDTSVWTSIYSFTTLNDISLVAPTNLASNQSVYTMLDWGGLSGVTYYDVELDTDAGFGSVDYQTFSVASSSSSMYVSDLKFETTYFWRTRARHSVDTTQWSATWSFSTLDGISLVSPTNLASSQSVYTMLDWSGLSGVTYYDVELDTDAGFGSVDYQTFSVASSSSSMYVSDLKFETTYFWRTRARHSVDTTQWSATWSFSTLDGISLVSPTNLANNQPLYLMLDWSGLSGVTYYDVDIDTVSTFNSADYERLVVSSSSSSLYISKEKFNQEYFWRVRARHSSDTTQWSATWSYTTTGTITNVSPTNGASYQPIFLNLDWSAITGNNGYICEIDTTPSFNSSKYQLLNSGVDASNIDVANLLFGTTYYWRAAAKSSGDTTDFSTIWNFTTAGEVSNVSPTNGAVNQQIEVTLDWSAITGNDGYIYQLDTTADFSSPFFVQGSSAINTSQITVYNLYFGTTYYWRAAAKSSNDTTLWSTTWNFTTTDYVSNVSPSNEATNQLPTITLDWTAITGNNGYIYQLDTTADFSSPLFLQGSSAISTSQITIYNLYFGKTYYWRAAAKSVNDTSGWSPIWHFTTLNSVSNVSPANGATNQNISLTLDWSAVDGNNGYLCEVDTSPNFNSGKYQLLTSTVNSSQITASSLLYGATYYWHAAVKHDVDTSAWSTSWKFTTAFELVDYPTLVSPADNSTDIPYSSTYIEWTQSTGATTYQYEYSTDINFENSVFSGITSLSYKLISNLIPYTTYYWRVRGQNVTGNSPWSEAWMFTTENATLVAPSLASPANNAIGIDFNSITLDWESVFGASEYTYQISPDSNFAFAVTSQTLSETEASLLGFESNSFYYWRVKSSDGLNESDWSETWNFKTTFGVNVENIEKNDVVVYPNPSTGIIYVECGNYERIEIVNLFGQIIYNRNISTKKEMIDLCNYSKGVYFMNFVSKNKTVSKMLILQ